MVMCPLTDDTIVGYEYSYHEGQIDGREDRSARSRMQSG